MNEVKNAVSIGTRTLVGYFGNYPIKPGNCFSVNVENENTYYKIVNFGAENLEELISRGLTWPIKIKVLDGHIAVIHDSRIEDEWYNDHFCGVCCPHNLLPLTQQLEYERKIGRGDIVILGEIEGFQIRKEKISTTSKTLNLKFSLDNDKECE